MKFGKQCFLRARIDTGADRREKSLTANCTGDNRKFAKIVQNGDDDFQIILFDENNKPCGKTNRFTAEEAWKHVKDHVGRE